MSVGVQRNHPDGLDLTCKGSDVRVTSIVKEGMKIASSAWENPAQYLLVFLLYSHFIWCF